MGCGSSSQDDREEKDKEENMVVVQEPLTESMLTAALPQEQKQMLGARLFPLIQRMFPNSAVKITGMLLEMDNAELVHMLEDQKSLKEKVEDAVAVLQAHQGKARINKYKIVHRCVFQCLKMKVCNI
jgi:hypothetical protein